VTDDGSLVVSSGGAASGTTLFLGSETVSGTELGASLKELSVQDVYGTVSGTAIGDFASQTVHAGASDVSATLGFDAVQVVLGSASGDVVSGGAQEVQSGGVASAVVIAGGSGSGELGQQYVASGGTAIGTTVESGASQFADTDATASNTVISGGIMEVNSGAIITGGVTFAGSGSLYQLLDTALPTAVISGFATGDTIDLQAVAYDSTGSATFGAGHVLTISEGGQSYTLNLDPRQVLSGATFQLGPDNQAQPGTDITVSVVVPSGGTLTVSSGQYADGVVVSGGGSLVVLSGGSASGTRVSGGTEIISAGGAEIGPYLSAGGSQVVSGTVVGAVLDDHDVQTVSSGGTASNTTISATDSQVVQSGGTAIGTVISGGTMDVQSGGSATGGITFSGTGGVLEIDGASLPTDPSQLLGGVIIAGLTPGNTIDLTGIALDNNGQANLLAGNELQITENGSVYDLQLDPSFNFAGDFFHLTPDSGSGTDITEDQTACYVRSTLIRAARGEVMVEDLAIGDLVMTISGEAKPIKWIGRRSYAGRFVAGNKDVLPICVKAGCAGGWCTGTRSVGLARARTLSRRSAGAGAAPGERPLDRPGRGCGERRVLPHRARQP
jgi:autotransporter passenger strand-loop-strand repeat protein